MRTIKFHVADGHPVFITSSEQTDEWMQVRACHIRQRLHGWAGDQYALANIDPPVTRPVCSAGTDPISQIVITPHSQGTTLFPLDPNPLPIYVFELVRPIVGDRVTQANVCMAAWCDLYSSRQGAEEALHLFTKMLPEVNE
jgi:hypothetical protein